MGIRSLTEEATRYLVPLLDPVKDKAEIARLSASAGEIAKQPRPITPIAIPLRDGLSAADITDDDASVAFDLDGSALHNAGAGFARTRRGSSSIAGTLAVSRRGCSFLATSRFGCSGRTATTRWGARRQRRWQDCRRGTLGSVGVARPKQRRPQRPRRSPARVGEWGIVALSCGYEHDARHPHEIAFSRRGVTFANGATRPTFDLVLTPAPAGR